MSKSFSDHFSEVASLYADFRPHYPAQLFDFLASLVPMGAAVWDCAAGNGQATTDLASRFGKILATDASREQISSATRVPNITYQVATAEVSGLPDESVDLITVAQALHWFDLDRFYAEARRVLRPGGVLAVWAYGINNAGDEQINRVVIDFYSNIVGPYWPPERRLVEEGYRTIPFPFPELKPPSFEMEEHWTLDQLIGYMSTWSATNRYMKATGRNPLPALEEQLSLVWKGSDQRRRITWPLTLRVGRKGSAGQGPVLE